MWPWPEEEFSRRRHSDATEDPDTRIARDVVGRLSEDARLRQQHVTVEVQNRVLILTGTVDSPDARNAVAASARSVSGIREVCDMLRVSGSPRTGNVEAFDRIVGGSTAETAATSIPDAPTKDRKIVLAVLALLAWGLLSLVMTTLGIAAALTVTVIVGIVLTLVIRHRRPRCHKTRHPPSTE